MKKYVLLVLTVFCSIYGYSQSDFHLRNTFYQKLHPLGYDADDVKDMNITDDYVSPNGIRHIYFQQTAHRIPIIGTTTSLHFSKNYTTISNPKFIKSALEKAESPEAKILPEVALKQLLQQHMFTENALKAQTAPQLVYLQDEKSLKLCWAFDLEPEDVLQYGKYYIHAHSGQFIRKDLITLSCSFKSKNSAHKHSSQCHSENATLNANSSYLVYAQWYNGFLRPLNNPLDGDRQIIQNPAHPIASPLGWHESVSNKYTITRGNNVHAFQTLEGNTTSANDEPEGGTTLAFNPPLDLNQSLATNIDALVVNSFFTSNFMHDFAYMHGFDEASGNFQESNFTNTGVGKDEIKALASFNGNVTYENNAFFVPAPDGEPGLMFLPFWGGQEIVVDFNAPQSIQQSILDVGTASFGPLINDPITAEVVLAMDTGDTSSLACGTLSNGSQLNGKIAMIDRGTCFFTDKTIKAQQQGAIAVVICNNFDEVINMAGENDAINIPTVMLRSSDCDVLKINLPATLTIRKGNNTREASTDFDNGIIAHEYAHGISNRLVGGPSNNFCLVNEEQMGEGWSDFFTLVTTIQPGDQPDTQRPIGVYAADDTTGIRQYPYSRDMDINPLIMDELKNVTGPHAVGTFWATALWDLYWNLVDVYGFNENLMDSTGGNNLAVKLVMEGMRLTSCNPGFQDGRDAILQADSLLFDGANSCLIWNTFARRGMGFNMDQNSVFSNTDNHASFQTAPACATIKNISLEKTMSNYIQAGDTIDIQINIKNNSGITQYNLTLNDLLPSGSQSVQGSEETFTVVIDSILNGEERTFEYRIISNKDLVSSAVFTDIGEGVNFTSEGDYNFQINVNQKPDDAVWYLNLVGAANTESILTSSNAIRVPLNSPLLSFEHKMNSELNQDAGIIEVQVEGEDSWEQLQFPIKNGYDGSFNINSVRRLGFSGNYPSFQRAIFDLGKYAGQIIRLRFRFFTNGSISSQGWAIDNIDIFEQMNYNSEACVSADTIQNCITASTRGTIVLPIQLRVSNEYVYDAGDIKLFPNPASSTVFFASSGSDMIQEIRLIDITGKLLKVVRTNPTSQISINTGELIPGTYVALITTNHKNVTKKLVIGR